MLSIDIEAGATVDGGVISDETGGAGGTTASFTMLSIDIEAGATVDGGVISNVCCCKFIPGT